MAIAATRAISKDVKTEVEKIVDFSPEQLKAPFALRCAAITIDYMSLLALPVVWLTFGKFFSDRGLVVIGSFVWTIAILLFFGNFLLLPMVRGQSIGKLVTGLTIVNFDGSRLGPGAVFRRNLLGYAITVLTFGIGFFVAAVNSSGRALHDFTSGTIVVRGRKMPR